MANRILSAINNEGIFTFNSNGVLSTNSKSININSKSNSTFFSKQQTIIESSYLNLISNNNPIIIETKSQQSNNNLIQLSSTNGIIKLNSTQLDMNTINGNINLNAVNGNINIGKVNELNEINILEETDNNIELLTDTIQLESLRKISFNSEDIYAIASDSIHFISQSGDITFGSRLDKSFIRFENDNLLLNQKCSSANRILDINIDKEDCIHSYKTNGLLVKSSIPTISSDISCQNDKTQMLNIGITSSNSKQYHQYEKQLIGYQKDRIIYNYGPTYLINLDINKYYVWENNDDDNDNAIDDDNDDQNNLSIKNIKSYDIILKQQNSHFQIKVELTDNFSLQN